MAHSHHLVTTDVTIRKNLINTIRSPTILIRIPVIRINIGLITTIITILMTTILMITIRNFTLHAFLFLKNASTLITTTMKTPHMRLVRTEVVAILINLEQRRHPM